MEGAIDSALLGLMPLFCMPSVLNAALLAAAVSTASLAFAANCVPFAEAHHHLGKTQCITGRVVHAKEGNSGVTFLDFCENYETCPFVVVVFPGDLRKLGDVHQLKGRTIEIQGTVEEYDGRAEIILRHSQQLGDSASLLPPLSKDGAVAPSLPADYDVERRGTTARGSSNTPRRPGQQRSKARRHQLETRIHHKSRVARTLLSAPACSVGAADTRTEPALSEVEGSVRATPFPCAGLPAHISSPSTRCRRCES